MKVRESGLPDVLIVEPRVFRDPRGFFLETFRAADYRAAGIDADFVQDDQSRSLGGVLRGMHYQLAYPQAKLVSVAHGRIFDVALDIRHGSPNFGRWTGVELSDENLRQLYIPAGFAHGFCVLSDVADVMYKCSDVYHAGDEYGIAWDDPTLAIDWPLADAPVLSDKDRSLRRLAEVPAQDLPVYRVDG